MKIILINPPYGSVVNGKNRKYNRKFPPLELLNEAALLRQNGFLVELYDFNIEKNLHLLSSAIASSRSASLIFISTNSYADWQCPSLELDFLWSFVEQFPAEKVFLQGNQGTHYPGGLLQKTQVAGVIRGEPEETCLEIAKLVKAGEQNLSSVLGLSYRLINSIKHNPERSLQALDTFPLPAWDLIQLSDYQYELMGSHFALLEASRGCPFSCNFCNRSMFQNKYRKKTFQRFIEEVDDLVVNHACKNLYVFDLEFTINTALVKQFSQHLIDKHYATKYGLKWACQTRADSVDAEMLKLVKRSGCELIHFGVEAGNEAVLKSTGKKITKAEIVKGFTLTKEAGISSAGFFILGHQLDTAITMNESIEFALELDPTYVSFHPLIAFPGSPLYTDKFGAPPYWDEPYPEFITYQSPDRQVLIDKMVRKAFSRFYFRPKILIRSFRRFTISQLFKQFILLLEFMWPTKSKL